MKNCTYCKRTNHINKYLKLKNMSGYRLAKILKVDEATVTRWRSQIHQPETFRHEKLCNILEAKHDELFT